MSTQQERKNYIDIKLDEIDKAFKSCERQEYVKFKYSNYDEDTVQVIVETVLYTRSIKISSKDKIKMIDQKLSTITSLIL